MEYEWDKENLKVYNLTTKPSESYLKPLKPISVSFYDIISIDIETYGVKVKDSLVQIPWACGYYDGSAGGQKCFI